MCTIKQELIIIYIRERVSNYQYTLYKHTVSSFSLIKSMSLLGDRELLISVDNVEALLFKWAQVLLAPVCSRGVLTVGYSLPYIILSTLGCAGAVPCSN